MKYKYNNNFNELGANVTNNFPYRPIDGLPQIKGWSVIESESSATEDNILYFVLDNTAKDLFKTPIKFSVNADADFLQTGELKGILIQLEDTNGKDMSNVPKINITGSGVFIREKEYFVNRKKPGYVKIGGTLKQKAGGKTSSASMILYKNEEILYKASGTADNQFMPNYFGSLVPLIEDPTNALSWFEAIQQCTAVGITVFAGEEGK